MIKSAMIYGLFALLLLCPSMAIAGVQVVPTGYRALCKEKPQFCMRDRMPVEDVRPYAETRRTLPLLRRINAKWNKGIKAVVDIGEQWTGSTVTGDCEEFAIAKRMDLLKLNFLPSQVLLVRVLDKNGEGHLVTAVRTDQAVYILDNLVANILTLEESGYTLTSRQREDRPSEWTAQSF